MTDVPQRRWLAIDPDTKHVAVSKFSGPVWTGWELIPANPLHTMVEKLKATGAEFVVCETPHVTRGRAADPQDLVNLALVAGAALGAFPSMAVLPHMWKGSVSKEISHRRLLTHIKKHLYEPINLQGLNKDQRLDVLDSAAIGYSFINGLRHV